MIVSSSRRKESSEHRTFLQHLEECIPTVHKLFVSCEETIQIFWHPTQILLETRHNIVVMP